MDKTGIEKWLKSGKYLPRFMQDFHDQKNLFKTIHQTINVEAHEYAKDINWVKGLCYVIDVFLWYMARRGYTLQKSRMDLPFNDLDADMATAKQIRDKASMESLKDYLDGRG